MAGKGKKGGGGRLASFFVVVGCLTVLAGTFMLGVVAGRRWPALPVPGLATKAKAAREPGARDRTARAPEPGPTLTFYQELTAPLTAPPAPRPAKPAPRAEKSDRADRFEAAARADTPDTPDTPEAARREEPAPAPREGAAAAPAPVKDARYTVQVAAYKARAPADSLRASLAAAGQDAYVVEGDGPGGVRYRVRVGSFATREAAQEGAARLGRERSLTAFVTAR